MKPSFLVVLLYDPGKTSQLHTVKLGADFKTSHAISLTPHSFKNRLEQHGLEVDWNEVNEVQVIDCLQGRVTKHFGRTMSGGRWELRT